MQIQAAILEDHGKPLAVVENIEAPPLRDGQVLVKILYSGVCQSQVHEVLGQRGADPYLPHMLGHEGIGEVIDKGSAVKKINIHDKIILGWMKGTGCNEGPTTYNLNGRAINAGPITTFSNYSIVSENRCVKMPAEIPDKAGVLLGCALLTGAGIILNEIRPQAGSTVAIIGLGGVGLSALMALRLFNPGIVIAVDIDSAKLALAQELGATHCVNPKKNDLKRKVLELTQNTGLDYCVEATGIASSIEEGFSLVRNRGGLCVFASHPKSGDKIALDPHHLISGKRIQGSWGGECDPDRDIPRIAKLINEHDLPVEKLLSKPFTLLNINQAIDDLKHGKALRPLIKMTH